MQKLKGGQFSWQWFFPFLLGLGALPLDGNKAFLVVHFTRIIWALSQYPDLPRSILWFCKQGLEQMSRHRSKTLDTQICFINSSCCWMFFFLNELGCLLCCQSIWRLSHDSSKRRKIWHDESDEHKRFKGNYDTWRRKAVGSYSLTGIWKQRSMTSHWAFIYLQGKCQCSGFETIAGCA